MEAISWALKAALTGHLVLATIHAASVLQVLVRLSSLPEAGSLGHISEALIGVMAQKIISDKNHKRHAIFELVINTPAVAHLIREQKWPQIQNLLTMQMDGMFAFEQSGKDERDWS